MTISVQINADTLSDFQGVLDALRGGGDMTQHQIAARGPMIDVTPAAPDDTKPTTRRTRKAEAAEPAAVTQAPPEAVTQAPPEARMRLIPTDEAAPELVPATDSQAPAPTASAPPATTAAEPASDGVSVIELKNLMGKLRTYELKDDTADRLRAFDLHQAVEKLPVSAGAIITGLLRTVGCKAISELTDDQRKTMKAATEALLAP